MDWRDDSAFRFAGHTGQRPVSYRCELSRKDSQTAFRRAFSNALPKRAKLVNHRLLYTRGIQKGFRTTRKTIPIKSKVGISFQNR